MRIRSMKRLIVTTVLLACMPVAALAQFGGASPVELSEARLTQMAPTMQVAGTVVSRSDAFLSAEVEGRLIEVADVGTRVEVGDVIASIEDTGLRLRAQELAAEIDRTVREHGDVLDDDGGGAETA